VKLRIDTPIEIDIYKDDGILPFVLPQRRWRLTQPSYNISRLQISIGEPLAMNAERGG